jgi:hypothetical protein
VTTRIGSRSAVEVQRRVDAPADAVWKVLADGWVYPVWVVGAARMREVDEGWPGVGARLYHSIGTWPLLIDDTTHVLASRSGRELKVRGRGWPTGEVEVQLLLEPEGDRGCRVRMREDVVAGPARLLPAPLRQALIAPRNNESLRRLAYLAENRSR